MAREFYARDALDLAPDLLGKLLVAADGRVGRILEVEAYRGAEDPASHAFRGQTARNAAMFGPPGRLYVYFTYGMHYCANVVAGADGEAQAVLLRALAPVEGLEAMRKARWRRRPAESPGPDGDLCRGPARLCQAFGIDRTFDGAELVGRPPSAVSGDGVVGSGGAGQAVSGDDVTRGGGSIWLEDDGAATPALAVTTRIGVTAGADLPWRFAVAGHPGVSGRLARA